MVITHRGRDQIVTCANPWLISHDPDTGKRLWRADCLEGGYYVVPSPVYAGGMVLAATEGALLAAVRPDGSGDASETRVSWTVEDDLPNVCTPLSDGELVFLLTSEGLLTCLELRSGQRLWQKDFSDNDREFQASPTLVFDRLYLLDTTGTTHILQATRKPKVIGRAELGEPCPGASPAFGDGRIYIRSKDHLFCIGQKKGSGLFSSRGGTATLPGCHAPSGSAPLVKSSTS